MMDQVISICSLRNKIYPKISTGRIVGYMLFLSYFTLLPTLLKIIWPILLNNFTINQIYVGSVFALNIGLFTIYNTIMYFIYTMKIPFFQKYRNTQDPWPWQQNPKEWSKLKKKTFKYLFINFFIVTPVFIYISLLTSLPYSFSLQSWPNKLQLVLQFIFFLLVQDILFYFSHVLVHHPSFYWFHKIHHQYHKTVGIASHYVHPLEYLLSGTIPSSLGFMILGLFTPVHYVTILIWLIFRLLQSYEGHCGYQWTWNILSLFPATVGSDYHDFHHSNNSGNYGSVFVFWDAIFNTQQPYLKYLKKKVKQKKQ